MFNSDILEVATGLVFVYLLMSLIATAARESLEVYLKKRGSYLERGLMELFGHELALLNQARAGTTSADEPTFMERFYLHPLIFSLFRGGYSPPEDRADKATRKQTSKEKSQLPSYIPAANFAAAVLNVAEGYLKPGAGGEPLSFDRLRLAAWAVPNEPVRRILLMALGTAQGDVERAKKFLENWYDGSMDRVAGWYKRHTQIIVFFAGLVLCVLMNVNTMVIGHALHESDALRAAVGEAVTDRLKNPPPDAQATPDASASQETLQALGLPIGWGQPVQDLMASRLGIKSQKTWTTDILSVRGVFGLGEILAGWFMTAFAITLGAPFWFDVLNKIMIVRSTVKPKEKSQEEPSKDGAPSKPPAAAAGPPVADEQAANKPVLSQAAAGRDEIAGLDPDLRPRDETDVSGQELASQGGAAAP